MENGGTSEDKSGILKTEMRTRAGAALPTDRAGASQ